MTLRVRLAAVLIVVIALLAWRTQLFVVSRPGAGPRPLEAIPAESRRAVALDVTLPAVPVGSTRLRAGEGVMIVHYWAPWERRALAQATALDSLRRLEAFAPLRVEVVCFDPFPSVARYVARQRFRLDVVLDRDRRLANALPCPSLPYTYVLDRRGRIAVAQAGEVDWFAPATLNLLAQLMSEPAAEPPRLPPI